MVRPRALVEFVGGPADGTRVRALLDTDTGRPPEIRVWTHVIHNLDTMPVVAEVLYELREAPDDRAPFWRYVLPGSSADFGFDPDDDDDPDDTQER
jgi:hypothetical protein